MYVGILRLSSKQCLIFFFSPCVTQDGWNAMMCAAQSGCVPVVEYLLKQGLALDATDGGYTVCYAAAYRQ